MIHSNRLDGDMLACYHHKLIILELYFSIVGQIKFIIDIIITYNH